MSAKTSYTAITQVQLDDELQNEADGVGPTQAHADTDTPKPCLSENTKKLAMGLLIVIGISLSWAGTAQFAKSTFDESFNAPYFFIWFSTAWMIVCFPFYAISVHVFGSEKLSFSDIYSDCITVYGEHGLTPLSFFTKCGLFCVIWIVTNYMYLYALSLIMPTDVAALFSSNAAFVYILSWVILHEKFVSIRILAVVMAITGIVLMMYSDGFGGATFQGISLAVGSALGSAIYQVCFKKIVGSARFGQVAIFLSLLGVFNILLMWPLMLAFYLTGAETYDWFNLPWMYLCGSSVLGLVFNFLVNFGIALTYPLFIAVGIVLGIPVNAVADVLWRDAIFSGMKIAASVLICLAFLILLLPPNWNVIIKDRFTRRQKSEENGDIPRPDTRNSRFKSVTGV